MICSSFKAAPERKTARYERLAGDLRVRGFTCLNLPLEIGCKGVINARNHLVLETLFNMFKIRARKRPIASLGRTALLGSYRMVGKAEPGMVRR